MRLRGGDRFDCDTDLMVPNLSFWHVSVFLVYPAAIALGFWLLYTVIRLAVRRGLRQHQEWLETRAEPGNAAP